MPARCKLLLVHTFQLALLVLANLLDECSALATSSLAQSRLLARPPTATNSPSSATGA